MTRSNLLFLSSAVLVLAVSLGSLFIGGRPAGDGVSYDGSPMNRLLASISGDSIAATTRLLSRRFTRRMASEGAAETVRVISEKLRGYGWRVERQEFEIDDGGETPITLVNVIADPIGSMREDSVLVVCAHYDSRGKSNGDVAPGADDNASGTAVVMELARVFGELSPAERPARLELVFFGGEEDSLLGSSGYVKSFLRQGRRLIGALNVDMVGYDREGPGDFVVFSNERSLAIAEEFVSCSGFVGLRCDTNLTDTANSDQASFWQAGLRAVGVWEGFDHNPFFHTPLDTPDKLSPAFMEKVARVVACVVAGILEAEPPGAHPLRPGSHAR